MSAVIEIGEGRTLMPYVRTEDGPIIGYIETHPNTQTGEPCSGSVWTDREASGEGGPLWTVVQADPLTLTPSIACRTCGNHGFVRDGRWVPV